MTESVRARYVRWGLEELQDKYPDLRVTPSADETLTLKGELSFRVKGPIGDPIEDHYFLEIVVPPDFPVLPPRVRETGGRIAKDFHKLEDGSLCLGAPAEYNLKVGPTSTLDDFIRGFVVPYLFGHSYFQKTGIMPFDELDHGPAGLRQHFADLFRAKDRAQVNEYLRLTSLKRRRANKQRCPCGSGRRLGRCHNRVVNRLRDQMGRLWFRWWLENLNITTKREAAVIGRSSDIRRRELRASA